MRHDRFSVINLSAITCKTERHQNTLLFEDELVTVTGYKNVQQLLGEIFFFVFLFHFYVHLK